MDRENYIASIAKLLQAYLSRFTEDQERLPVLLRQVAEEDGELTNRKNMVGHLTGSALVVDGQSRVLLIKHNMLQRWLQPGGHLDFEEWPADGSLRELVEETGISKAEHGLKLHRLHDKLGDSLPIDVDSHQIPENWDKGEGPHLHHDFQYVYELSESADKLNLQEEEVSQFRWLPLQELLGGTYGVRLQRVAGKILTLSR